MKRMHCLSLEWLCCIHSLDSRLSEYSTNPAQVTACYYWITNAHAKINASAVYTDSLRRDAHCCNHTGQFIVSHSHKPKRNAKSSVFLLAQDERWGGAFQNKRSRRTLSTGLHPKWHTWKGNIREALEETETPWICFSCGTEVTKSDIATSTPTLTLLYTV